MIIDVQETSRCLQDMQKTPMIMDKSGKFTCAFNWVVHQASIASQRNVVRPSTYCDPQTKPKYEQEEVGKIIYILRTQIRHLEDHLSKVSENMVHQDLDEVLIEELEMLEALNGTGRGVSLSDKPPGRSRNRDEEVEDAGSRNFFCLKKMFTLVVGHFLFTLV